MTLPPTFSVLWQPWKQVANQYLRRKWQQDWG